MKLFNLSNRVALVTGGNGGLGLAMALGLAAAGATVAIAARRDVGGLHEAVLNRTPARRWGVPDDVAGVAVFLAAEASNFVTGACIPVDGGYSVRG